MPWTKTGNIRGPQGVAGPAGANGQGVPAGGTVNQILAKKTAADYDTQWENAPVALPPGGTPPQSLTKKSTTDGDAQWTTLDNLEYLGDWAAGTYKEGDVVVYNGVSYMAMRPTSAAPVAWPSGVVDLSQYQPISAKGAANGYAPLDAGGRVPASQAGYWLEGGISIAAVNTDLPAPAWANDTWAIQTGGGSLRSIGAGARGAILRIVNYGVRFTLLHGISGGSGALLQLRDSQHVTLYGAYESVTFVFDGSYWIEIDRDVKQEIAYAEVTTNVTFTNTDWGAPYTICSVTFYADGSPVWVEYHAPLAGSGTNWTYTAVQEPVGGSEPAVMENRVSSLAGPLWARRKFTPPAGSHTYSWVAIVDGGTGAIYGAAYGAAYLRVLRP